MSDPPARDLPEDLGEILRHLESCYPSEGCGLVIRRVSDGALRVRPMPNAYDKYHLLEPESFPRSSRTAFLFDLEEQLAVYQDVDARGEEVACIFHSHTDLGAYLSAEDRAMAAPDGVPMAPGVSYLVVAVDLGRATAARLYRFQAGDFLETEVPLRPEG